MSFECFVGMRAVNQATFNVMISRQIPGESGKYIDVCKIVALKPLIRFLSTDFICVVDTST